MGKTTATYTGSPIIKRKDCRLCGGNLRDLFSLGNQYVNDFPKDKPTTIKCPLDVVECLRCSLLQLKHTAPPELLYTGQYWYKSGVNDTIVSDLRGIAEEAMSFMDSSDTILDIGANDGTLLSFIRPEYYRIGVEPARNLTADLRKHCDQLVDDYWNGYEGKAKVVTAIGMFYDLEEPLRFVQDVADCLADDGVFIAQLMTAKQMYENNDIGNICHEHLEFYTWKSLKYLFSKAGLEIFKVVETPINGGSYKLYARHADEGHVSYNEPEFDWELFERNIEVNREQMWEYLRRNKNVYGYGASTKGNTILQYYGLNSRHIPYFADKNPEKIGLKTITGIPIISEEEARKSAEHFFVIPYGFKDQFVQRERSFLNNGGHLVFSTPYFHVV